MLINCVAYQDGKKLADIPVEEISEYLKRPDCFVWVALYEPEAGELEKMQEEFGLHELAIEDASHGHQQPKIEEYGASLFAVLHTIDVNGDDLQIGEVDIFVGPNYILSIRRHAERGFQGVRARCEKEPHLLKNGSAFVLYALMDAVVDRYFPVLSAIEAELEKIEERIFLRNTARSNIEALYDLKRKLMTLKHAVEPLMEAMGRLYGSRVPQLCMGMREYFRDVYDHLSRIHASIEAIRDMQSTAIQVNLGMINLSETEVTKKLAGWAAIIAIPTLIAGIYGMNFKNMPEYDIPYGYPICIAVMVMLDLALYFWFRRIRWL
ncbi:MAG TPA: magnesium/cobalt transporter CorA [Burkholderiaceae bacterium]|nr:magnesium/cobalt transporter CorA [Burkholderiaceae bacterium]